MKKSALSVLLGMVFLAASMAQPGGVQIEGKEVFRNEDVVFRQIDDHTWVGTGHLMSNESLYLVEGSNKAVLIDAGTRIADLDKIVAGITDKPVTASAVMHSDQATSS